MFTHPADISRLFKFDTDYFTVFGRSTRTLAKGTLFMVGEVAVSPATPWRRP